MLIPYVCSVRSVRCTLDKLARGAHLRAGVVRQHGLGGAEGDRPNVVDPEIFSGQADRCRLSHRAASLAPSRRVDLRTALEQAHLEHVRRVEAFDAEDRAGRCRRGSCGHQTDELRTRDLDTASACLCFDSIDDLVQGRRFVVLDVHADLRTTGFRQEQSECAHTGEAATLLPYHCGDCPRDLHIVGGEVHVERNQQPARPDYDPTGALIESRRTEVQVELARVDTALELRGPPRR